MLQPFLAGLPRYLVELMMREYEYKCRRLSNWQERSRSQRLRPYLEKTAVIQQVIALGIYYRQVIAPLTSAGNFVHRLQSQHELGLQVAGKTVTPDLHFSLEAARIRFQQLSRSFGLEENFFAISDLNQIVMSLVRLEERRTNGNF
ncbi:MAG: hypothetical protein LC136_00565 [Burkholderiales bacterium]|jgi:hypothetical protein|nr:hypothetical protein [Burkholderiaceae bacterium]MCZ2412747.1 hypothetical protein [Burkholderiales bacterium]MDL1907460.1 hypothetical protein [Betaproteobacteria bacterium PRO1]OQZ07415.1 MAG: hypothetical protein B6D36_00020 [Planctomycetes bacterium UTPLA1]